MKSTLGRRANICKALGWPLDFVEHGISYAKLQMIMIDMPRHVHKGKDENGGGNFEDIEPTDDNQEEVFGMIFNGMSGKL